jgi:hypothetical protein
MDKEMVLAVQAQLKVDVVLVVDNERMYNELKASCPEGTTVAKITKSGGVGCSMLSTSFALEDAVGADVDCCCTRMLLGFNPLLGLGVGLGFGVRLKQSCVWSNSVSLASPVSYQLTLYISSQHLRLCGIELALH